MNKPKLKSIKVEHLAMLFLTFGIIVLYFMSLASEPVLVEDFSKLGDYEGEVVITKGIIIDLDPTSRNELVLTVLEPGDLESTLKIFIENSNRNFTIGDMIQVKGSVLKLAEGFLELVVVNEKDIEIIGHWHNIRLSIPELAHRLEHSPYEFRYLPVELSGFLKFEPRQPVASIRLSEHPTDGFYTVKVEVPNEVQSQINLHKGDFISLNVSVTYNENNFEYKLTLINFTLLQIYGFWDVPLQELTDQPFIFENALINTSGFIHDYEPYYNYILIFDTPVERRGLANCSIWVDITGLNLTCYMLQDDYFITLTGVLYYDPQYIDYAIKAEKIVTN